MTPDNSPMPSPSKGAFFIGPGLRITLFQRGSYARSRLLTIATISYILDVWQ
jgi:hypothetical protein